MKYLKQFETTAAYNAAKPNLILPNVSLITENHKVEYNPSGVVPPTPSHDYVEIGGVKWATMNIGANSITDYGLYFQWGDTQGYIASQVGGDEGQKYFGWEDYKYSEGGAYSDAGTITKYNDSDKLTTLQSSDDAVTAAWGGNWRMPTTAEFQALSNAVNTAWTSNYNDSGVAGLVCTDKTDSSKVLFFPAAGKSSNGYVIYVGDVYYWSSSINSQFVDNAYCFTVENTEVLWPHEEWRHGGFSVRGVLDE
jgi:uncharacterized protein (TIGR02145 family)